MRAAPVLSTLLALALAGCGGDDPAVSGTPVLSEPLAVVPFGSPLDGVYVQPANDSLDVTEHAGRTYLAFRTSASWFADRDTELQVVSAEGQTRWARETSFSTGDDLREPRFLSFGGRLFLFIGRFESAEDGTPVPLGTIVSELDDGEWSDPVDVLPTGFVVSRAHVEDGVAYLTAWGDEGGVLAVHFLTSLDGHSWEPVRADGPTVESGGGTDTDVLFRRDGSLFAVTTNARGDNLGWGSHLCRAATAAAAWTCTGDPRRFDGALLFTQGATEYLVARRNVTETGAYDLGRDDLEPEVQTQLYLDDYAQQPKRCSLFRIGTGDVPELVADLPSRGDTCAAALLRQSDTRVAIYYHSSPLDGPDVSLRVGQAGASEIDRVVIDF